MYLSCCCSEEESEEGKVLGEVIGGTRLVLHFGLLNGTVWIEQDCSILNTTCWPSFVYWLQKTVFGKNSGTKRSLGKKLENRGSRVEPILTVFMIFCNFDRFLVQVNKGYEPDRTHARITVESVEPAGPVRVWKHWLKVRAEKALHRWFYKWTLGYNGYNEFLYQLLKDKIVILEMSFGAQVISVLFFPLLGRKNFHQLEGILSVLSFSLLSILKLPNQWNGTGFSQNHFFSVLFFLSKWSLKLAEAAYKVNSWTKNLCKRLT